MTERSLRDSAVRHVIAGGLNTLLTGVLLGALSYVTSYGVAYAIAFATGVVIATITASHWVFSSRGSIGSAIAYAACYVVIFGIGLGYLAILNRFGLPPLANMSVVLLTAPLSFVAGRLIFRARPTQGAS